MMELESGFLVEPDGLDGGQAGPELLHRSVRGFAEIWRVEKFGQFVVLKALKPEFRGDPVYEALLRKEFDIGYSLNHPSICRTWHFRHHPELGSCIEMEWVDGVTLSERFGESKPDDALFRKIALELCDAVAYLHSRQVIHRDIKPSNILITHNGDNVKLVDFGLADTDASTILKMQAGTQRYLAPEVLGGGEADIRTDIWAVGRVLRELTSSHSHALRKACADDPGKRWQHIPEFKKALLRPSLRPWLIAVASVGVVVCIGAALQTVYPHDVQVDPTPVELSADTLADATPAPDTVSLKPEKPVPPVRSASGKPAGGKPAAGKPASATRDAIDALFRDATDLFEEKED